MKIIHLAEVDSTNNWLSVYSAEAEAPMMVYCDRQTAGRGQRGNSWESEPGQNLTCSILLKPENFAANRQFLISECTTLALVELLKNYGIEARIKWPNDIYAGDFKICGILTEHNVTGSNITKTVVGIGLNVNQIKFASDAPNPISMTMITGKKYDVAEIASKLAVIFESKLSGITDSESVHAGFIEKIWRMDGKLYPFLDKKKKELIQAKISRIDMDGLLHLTEENGEIRTFFFKEVEFLL